MNNNDMKDKSIHLTSLRLSDELKENVSYDTFFSSVQKLVSSTSVVLPDFRMTLLDAMKNYGLETDLRNKVYHWIRSHRNFEGFYKQNVKEPLAYIRKSQVQWERRIHRSLNSMSKDIGIPISRFRIASERDELNEKWTELSTCDFDLSLYRPVYAPKDFLEVVLNIRCPNSRAIESETPWDLTQIPLKVKSLGELRSMYNEISRGESLLGVNPHMPSSQNFPTLEAERTVLGDKVLFSKHAPLAQEFLKRGCPKGQRGKIWALVLGSTLNQTCISYFKELKRLVLQYDTLVDKLIIKDVQLTASNDDQYFVFEDILYQVMLCFSRDSEVTSIFNQSSSSPIHATLKNLPLCIENYVIFPPNGIIPFHGFAMYAAPFCYLYEDPIAVYFTFRAFYMRYWFRLHQVSSHEQGLLCLCLLFEKLLQIHEPQLWFHFKRIKIEPIKVTFKWIMRAFSGHLPPEQLFSLWDLVLAYDSLEIVPLLAVAILSFRKDNLLRIDTLQNVEAVLADLSSISVMTLLQLTLLKD